ELFIMLDAHKRASVNTINVIMPYFGYARQDRKAYSREPISAKLIANLLQKSGVERLITIDLHASQIQSFFDMPVNTLQSVPILSKYFKQNYNSDFVIVSPNSSGVPRSREMGKSLNA